MKQTITITLDLKIGQRPYTYIERRKYKALLAFFENIDYKVESIFNELSGEETWHPELK